MWLFGKRLNIRNAAREEDEEEAYAEELPSFAPEIETGISEYKEPEVCPSVDLLPDFDEEEERPFAMPNEGELAEEEEVDLSNEVEEQEDTEEDSSFDTVALLNALEKEEDLPEEIAEEEPEEPLLNEDDDTPKEIYEQLKSLSYAAKTYGLSDNRMLLVHPDGNGGLYLFEEYGDYQVASPDKCKAFVRLKGLKGRFKGKNYATSDFEYVLKNRAWPLCVLATNKAQYRSAIDQGYKPYKTTSDEKGMLLCKDVSLYRIKDLTLWVELTVPSPVLTTCEYLVTISRATLEQADCEKEFKKLCRKVGEYLLENGNDVFFTVQVLKTARNLVVCFPLDGVPAKGDRFGGDVITALAPSADGTLILQIGNDQEARLPFVSGAAYKGQHALELPTE